MGQRLQLQSLLEDILDSRNVYFQPPANVTMQYPCIVYMLNSAQTEFANNSPYRYTKRYQLTVIDQDPDSDIPEKIAALPLCLLDRVYTADNLNHNVFNIYF